MKLTDILSLEKWIALEKEINRISGLDSNVFDTNGIRITDFKKWANRLCPVIKDNDKGQSFICAVAHMNIATQAMNAKQIVIEECDAGFLKLVVPVFLNNEFIGAVGACGLLLDDGEVDSFMINKTINLEENEIERLSKDTGKITRKELESLGNYIKKEVDKIINSV